MTSSPHPVDQLFREMHSVEPYPPGVVPVPGRIPGIAFFPGGAGLWGASPNAPLPTMPVGGIMVLGHDFHSEAGFRQSLAQGTEVVDGPQPGHRTPPTWTGLRQLFGEVGIALESCFFTNAYMGLRKGDGTTGRFPGSLDKEYIGRSRAFLLRQIASQQPSVILTLGTWVPSFIAPLSPQLTHWKNVGSIKKLDDMGPVVHDVTFPGTSAKPCAVAALTHPSLRSANINRRHYKGVQGHASEVMMIRDAIRRSDPDGRSSASNEAT